MFLCCADVELYESACRSMYVKVKVEHSRGAHLPFSGHRACRWVYHGVCDAWPVNVRPMVTFIGVNFH